MFLDIKHKKISEIEDMEDYTNYLIDVDGNVYSLKGRRPRRLKPGWAKKKNGYLYVRLYDKYKNGKNFYIHRLVASAFLPIDDPLRRVRHKNHNTLDNRIDNLEWIVPKQITNIIVDDTLTDKIKSVHIASIRKGLPIQDSQDFMNHILDNALNEYVNRYGLRKEMAG